MITGRTSIAMASKLDGLSVYDFFDKLQLFGFEIDKTADAIEENDEKKPVPDFMKSILPDKIIELDVRPIMKRARFLYYVSSVEAVKYVCCEKGDRPL